jgi:hypothetical protein
LYTVYGKVIKIKFIKINIKKNKVFNIMSEGDLTPIKILF